ncbi:MAG: glycosyltransferase [Candidatus Aminicenantes bacterium]|nr:glycosyltransferase [Candidatus Aminicenantes bacterium]
MKIALLSPMAWETPSPHSSFLEKFVSLLAQGLVRRGLKVTLFAPQDSITQAKVAAMIESSPEEGKKSDIKVAEYLYLANVMEKADQFDLIHNNFNFPPLVFSELIKTPFLTTIHSLPSKKILPVYKKYNQSTFYVAISQAAKCSELDYLATIYPGIDLKEFIFNDQPEDYLIFFGCIHPNEGTWEAIELAKKANRKLIIVGVIQDKEYFERQVAPQLDGDRIKFIDNLSSPELTQLLSSAYALIYPVNYEKPFSFSLIEAMACGTPVIALKKGAVPELVVDGQTGFIVENLDEAIGKVDEIKRLNRADCRRWVETQFSQEKMVDEYIQVYQRIVEGTLGRGYRGLRPWGRYIVLEEKEKHKVKRIEIYEGMRLSYQRHRRRSEHWFILQGKALVTIDGQEKLLSPGESVDISAFSLHRIEAREGTVVFIEIQRGDYLGEDDIERVEDDFGRLQS